MPSFAGSPYPTHDAMLQAMARRWLEGEADFATKSNPVLAEECAEAWHLADGHMEAENYDIEDLERAFTLVRNAKAPRGEAGGAG